MEYADFETLECDSASEFLNELVGPLLPGSEGIDNNMELGTMDYSLDCINPTLTFSTDLNPQKANVGVSLIKDLSVDSVLQGDEGSVISPSWRSSYSSSSYSTLSSSIASTPSRLSGINTPANPNFVAPKDEQQYSYAFTESEFLSALQRKLQNWPSDLSDSGVNDASSIDKLSAFKQEPPTPPSSPSMYLPRHKRPTHRKAEKKRVEKIKTHLDHFKSLCHCTDKSEAKVLEVCVAALRDVTHEYSKNLTEINSLKLELQQLEREQTQMFDYMESLEYTMSAVQASETLTASSSQSCHLTLSSRISDLIRQRSDTNSKFKVFYQLVGHIFCESFCDIVQTSCGLDINKFPTLWLTSVPLAQLRRRLYDNLRKLFSTCSSSSADFQMPDVQMSKCCNSYNTHIKDNGRL